MYENIENTIKLMVKSKNVILAGEISAMMWKKGMSYREIYESVNKTSQISKSDWDEMLYEYDTISSGIL
jgi:adenylosuccinate lyase